MGNQPALGSKIAMGSYMDLYIQPLIQWTFHCLRILGIVPCWFELITAGVVFLGLSNWKIGIINLSLLELFFFLG